MTLTSAARLAIKPVSEGPKPNPRLDKYHGRSLSDTPPLRSYQEVQLPIHSFYFVRRGQEVSVYTASGEPVESVPGFHDFQRFKRNMLCQISLHTTDFSSQDEKPFNIRIYERPGQNEAIVVLFYGDPEGPGQRAFIRSNYHESNFHARGLGHFLKNVFGIEASVICWVPLLMAPAQVQLTPEQRIERLESQLDAFRLRAREAESSLSRLTSENDRLQDSYYRLLDRMHLLRVALGDIAQESSSVSSITGFLRHGLKAIRDIYQIATTALKQN